MHSVKSADELDNAETDFANKKARISKAISEVRQQRGRLQNILENAESEMPKDLRRSSHAYSMVMKVSALKKFHCRIAGPRDRTSHSTFPQLMFPPGLGSMAEESRY